MRTVVMAGGDLSGAFVDCPVGLGAGVQDDHALPVLAEVDLGTEDAVLSNPRRPL